MTLFQDLKQANKKEAFRIGLQSAFAAVFTFLILKLLSIDETFVGVISAVLIVEPSIGDTIGQARNRVIATIAGSILGFCAAYFISAIAGKIVLLALSIFLMNFISSFKKSWKYGIVAVIVIALGNETDIYNTTIQRLISIGIGSFVGVLVSLIIWPSKAEDRAKDYLKKAIKATSERFKIALENTRIEKNKTSKSAINTYNKNIDLAQQVANTIKFSDKTVIKNKIEYTRLVYNSIIILDRISYNSNKNISNGDAEINKDINELKEVICNSINEVSNELNLNKDSFKKLSDKISVVTKNINLESDSNETKKLRYTMLFALNQIESSLEKFVSD